MLVPIAEYRPDVADLNANYTDDLRNVLSSAGGYMPFRQFVGLTAALPSRPLGWLAVKTLDGSIRFFAGTATNLYTLNATTMAWTEISKTTGAYNATQWSIKAFGTYIIAVNANDAPQVMNIGTDVKFRDLGGSPPRASTVRIWGDFVALMGIPSAPNRVQWSGLNNPEFWTPGSQNSDYQDFPDGGRVQGSNEATNPLIFMENAIYKGVFVPGSRQIFTFQKVHDKRGAYSAKSIASRGSTTFFADVGGFFQIEADGALSPIGFEKVDRTLFGSLLSSSMSEVSGVIDPFYSRVYWLIDTTGSGISDAIAVYDWQLQQWTMLDCNVVGIMPLISFGVTLEALDSLYPVLDAMPISLDSKQWQGGAPVLAAFSTANTLGTFTGTTAEARVSTQEIGSSEQAVSRTTATYPVVDCEDVWVSVGVRMRRSDTFTWLPEQTRSSNTGQVRKRSRARFHKLKMRIPAGAVWTMISGVDVETAGAGKR